ncbi:MAG: autotransporter outer membrane beta-barrel domain-containing protein [Fusobacteriaceae bacterium]|jgi:predicted outer membrane repeat protein|nr:autotransporter outer membrane beta-barrel domain-containing protein [Fusobacteriaceae bacterium]
MLSLILIAWLLAKIPAIRAAEKINEWIAAPEHTGVGNNVSAPENQAISAAIMDYLTKRGDLDAVKAAIRNARESNQLATAEIALTSDYELNAKQDNRESLGYHVILGRDLDGIEKTEYYTVSIHISGDGNLIIDNEKKDSIQGFTIASGTPYPYNQASEYGSLRNGGVFYNWPTGFDGIPILVLTGDGDSKYIFTRQHARLGGAIFNSYGYVYIEHAIFIDNENTGDSEGGAIFNARGKMILHDVDFIHNRGNYLGGALCNYYTTGGIYSGYLRIKRVTFRENFTTDEHVGHGGAAAIGGEVNIIEDASFLANRARGKGGAIYMANPDPFDPTGITLELTADEGDILFAGNYAENHDPDHPDVSGGGAIYATPGSSLILNGNGDFYFGDKDSTDPDGGNAKDNVDSVYMDQKAVFTKTGTGFLQMVGSHKIDASNGGKFEIQEGALRIANNGMEGTEVLAVTNDVALGSASATAAELAGYGKISAASYTLKNVKINPDHAILTPGGNHEEELKAAPVGTLVLNARGRIDFHSGVSYHVDIDPATGTNDLIKITGAPTVSGNLEITGAYGSAPAAGDRFTVLESDGDLNVSAALTPSDFLRAARLSGSLDTVTDTQKITIVIEKDNGSLDLIWKGVVSDVWKHDEEPLKNWKLENPDDASYYRNNDNVTFTATGAGVVQVDPAGVAPSKMTVSDGDYTFTGGAVVVAGDLDIAGGVTILRNEVSAAKLKVVNNAGLILDGANLTAANIEVRTSDLVLDGSKVSLKDAGGSPGALDVDGKSVLSLYNYPEIRGNLKISGQMNYYAPEDFKISGGKSLVTVTGHTDITDSVIDIRIPGSGDPLHPSDKIVLLHSATLTGEPGNIIVENDTIVVEFGSTLAYSFFELYVEENKLMARLAADLSEDEALTAALRKDKALSEARIGGLTALNAGGDLIGESGMRTVAGNFRTADHPDDCQAFSVSRGGFLRYHTGSRVDLKSFSVAAGLTKGKTERTNDFVWGAFFEYGNGSYDAFNAFAGAGYVHGKGNIRYLGGGLLGRLDYNGAKGRPYLEGSVRAGRIKNHYDGSRIAGVAKYDAASGYGGFHTGVGTVLPLDDSWELDLSAKYFYTRTGGETVSLSSGEEVAFGAATSSRLRLGTRLSRQGSLRFQPYAAAYYEYEFDGRIKADIVAAGLPIESPELKGAAWIGELGLMFQPFGAVPFTVDSAVQGYAGKREGVTGTLHFKYKF